MKNAFRARTISRAQTYKRRLRRTIGLAALGVAAAFAVLVPLTASGAPGERLYIGMNLHFTGATTTAGTFVASGAVTDSGTAAVEHLALVPIGNSDAAKLSGDETFTSQNGTIATHFDGIAFPLSDPHQVGKGRFQIVSGTGAYAELRGQGTFLIVVDPISNQLIGTEEGSASR
jgi:hypothetical protein